MIKKTSKTIANRLGIFRYVEKKDLISMGVVSARMPMTSIVKIILKLKMRKISMIAAIKCNATKNHYELFHF